MKQTESIINIPFNEQGHLMALGQSKETVAQWIHLLFSVLKVKTVTFQKGVTWQDLVRWKLDGSLSDFDFCPPEPQSGLWMIAEVEEGFISEEICNLYRQPNKCLVFFPEKENRQTPFFGMSGAGMSAGLIHCLENPEEMPPVVIEEGKAHLHLQPENP